MNRSWVRFPQAAQIRPPGSGWAFLYACLLLVAPRVFRATRGLFGPGCLVCPWAAARPRAVRAASFARRVVSKPGQAPQASRRPPIGRGVCVLPGQALPPPTSTAPWPCRPRCQSRFTPSHRTLIVEFTINFACNSPAALSNHEFRLLELQRFQTLLNLLSIELHASFLRPGPVATFGLRGQALRLEVRSVPPVSATPGVLRGVA